MNTRKTFNAALTSLLLSVAILVEPACAAAPRAGLQFPPTAAGKLAELRLKAFNSGKAEKLAAFKRAHDPQLSVEDELGLRQMTGGLDAIRIEHSDAFHLTVMLRERGGDRVGKMMLELDPNNPNRLASFSLQPLPEVPPDLMPARLSSAAAWRLVQTKAKTMAQQERFAGSVAVARHGVILHEQSWGDADRTTHLKNTSATRFRIASMYKMLTTVAVLQLVEQQRIDLDAPLIRYLPSYPNRSLAEQVSIRHLLTHTGGTGDIFTEEFQQQRQQLREHADYLSLFGERAVAFAPGTREEYSNYGFVLLGAVIEAVTHKTYHEFIHQCILEPAGMRDTGTEAENTVASTLSIGYMRNESGLVSNRETLPWRGTAAGGGYSTTHDLLRFAQALLDGRLISRSLLTQAISAQTPSKLVGLGFQIGGEGEAAYFGHDGGAAGMSGAMRIYPATGDMIVALSNLDPPASDELVQYYANRMPLASSAPSKRKHKELSKVGKL